MNEPRRNYSRATRRHGLEVTTVDSLENQDLIVEHRDGARFSDDGYTGARAMVEHVEHLSGGRVRVSFTHVSGDRPRDVTRTWFPEQLVKRYVERVTH